MQNESAIDNAALEREKERQPVVPPQYRRGLEAESKTLAVENRDEMNHANSASPPEREAALRGDPLQQVDEYFA